MGNKHLLTIRILRWAARILSIIFVGFFLFLFIGETIGSIRSGDYKPISSFDVLQLTLMGLIMLGLIAAWIWEMYGGLLAFLACIGLFIIHPKLISSPIIFYLFNSVLFIITWWLKFHHRNDEVEAL